MEGWPRLGLVPHVVNFTDLSTGDVLTHTWDFGDGGWSFSANPTYTYSIPGTYTVSLTVENAADSDTVTRARYIHAVDVIYTAYLPIIVRDCRTEPCGEETP
jgi:PKD repeat protein